MNARDCRQRPAPAGGVRLKAERVQLQMTALRSSAIRRVRSGGFEERRNRKNLVSGLEPDSARGKEVP